MGYNFFHPFCLTAVATLWLEVKRFYQEVLQTMGSYLSVSAVQCPENSISENQRNTFVILKKNVDNNDVFSRLMQNYTQLKETASKVNETLGELFFITPFALSFFYAINFGRIFSAEGWAVKTLLYYTIAKNAAFMTLSADICHKVT